MSDETVIEKTEIPLGEASMAEFKKARSEGRESITQEVAIAKAEEVKTAEETKDEKPKAKGGFQSRIDRLVKQLSMAEEELENSKKELQAKGAPAKTEEKKAEDGEPQRDKFASEAEYIRALTRWEVKQEMKAERELEEREAQAAAQRESISSYNKRAIEASAKYDDWKEVMAQDTPLPSIVGDAIVYTIKNGPDLAYYLGKHPEICQAMLVDENGKSVHPLEAVAMAVKISEQLLGAKEEKAEGDEAEEVVAGEEKKAEAEKVKAKAPAPIRPVSGGTTKSAVPLDKVQDMRYYRKQRQAGRVQ